jgi:hypothetical protein
MKSDKSQLVVRISGFHLSLFIFHWSFDRKILARLRRILGLDPYYWQREKSFGSWKGFLFANFLVGRAAPGLSAFIGGFGCHSRKRACSPFPMRVKSGEQAAEKEYNVFAGSNRMFFWKSRKKTENLPL